VSIAQGGSAREAKGHETGLACIFSEPKYIKANSKDPEGFSSLMQLCEGLDSAHYSAYFINSCLRLFGIRVLLHAQL
jgi:hypothetical protein